MKTPKLPKALRTVDPAHMSATVRAMNPHLFGPAPAPVIPAAAHIADTAVKPARAKEPNRTEREYEMMLRREFPQAEIKWEAYTLRLASRATYTPDYSVLHPDGALEFHEVKGAFVFSKALQKPRIAAETFNHRFVLAQKTKEGWQITELAGAFQRGKSPH